MITIKRLECADVEKLVSSFIEVFNGAPWDDSWTAETAKKRLGEISMTPHFVGFYAEIEDNIAGAVLGNLSTGPSGRVYNMCEFFTAEKYRRQHIGQKMYDELVRELRQTNCKGIFLTTKKETAAFNFYVKNGLFELTDSAVMFGNKLA